MPVATRNINTTLIINVQFFFTKTCHCRFNVLFKVVDSEEICIYLKGIV